MDRPDIPLNALRTFETAARQGSFTSAAIELRVTQAAVSHQILRLEELLGVRLFHRSRTGLSLTSEAEALLPDLTASLDRIGGLLDRLQDGRYVEVLNIGVVTTFAAGWLLPLLSDFEEKHPSIKVKIFTNNNRVDIAREGLDAAIKFGSGHWPGLEATQLMTTPFAPLCAPDLALGLERPVDLMGQVLFRSYMAEEWSRWFKSCGLTAPENDGPVLDSSIAMANLAASGLGVALLPVRMFAAQVAADLLRRPFDQEVVLGSYWYTCLNSKEETTASRLFRTWMQDSISDQDRG
ncbi:LysR family transcriptional regulator [Cohaesibacter gelatinilyticus]|uniref:Transcriptional regulator, LysR family n=1 Tax=Cohaesibacter gelatinilyticus TaxID=372072 RepID=A0A285PD54_9HYPH|nr:LysR family transcriptional regulator [Cohaesibacter gelatinilyticus]SNZ19143.1 transcriptional regulator, LysR family [Cohaesibacter gelatinilyticus]